MESTFLLPHARLPDAYERWEVLASTVDASGRAHWLLADGERGPAYDARVVTVFADQLVRETHLQGVAVPFPMLEALPHGGFLVAAARRRRDEDNAQVFDIDGRPSGTFALGDAIEHLLADESGELWTGYFDEGVFGDDPLSHPGLRRWSMTGEPLWEFPASAADALMADCYALNVDRDTAWACYYTDFPLVRIGRDGSVRVWSSPVSGAHAVAVHGDHVAYLGGYDEHTDRIVLCTLAHEAAEPYRETTLVRPGGAPIGRRHLIARGARLYVQTEPYRAWESWELSAERSAT